MKPEFALSLSLDGITLLLRGAGGWRRVGGVGLDAEDLPTDLAILRSKAEELAKDQLTCKLLLPDSQIRYLSLDTGDLPYEDRIEAARKALEGATPYPVSDLAFDISPDGSQTHVAAVAIETLAEAESFAIEHGFSPLSFVAAPAAENYLGEPFFGTARAARGLDVEPDGIAVVEIGPLTAPPAPPPLEQAPQSTASAHQAPPLDAIPATPADSDAANTDKAQSAEAARDQTPATDQDADALTMQDPSPKASWAPEPGPVDDPARGSRLDDDLEAELAPRSDAPVTLPTAPPLPADNPQNDTAAPDDGNGEDSTAEVAAEPIVTFSSRRSKTSDAPTSDLNPADGSGTADVSHGAVLAATPMGNHLNVRAPAGPSALPPAPNLSIPSPALSHTTSAPPRRAPAVASRSPRDSAGDISQMPQARPLRLRPARIGLAAAALATLSALGAWALVQELPVLWSDLERADLVEAEDPIATPVLTHAQPEATVALSADRFAAPGAAISTSPLTPGPDQQVAQTGAPARTPFAGSGETGSEFELGNLSSDRPLDLQRDPDSLTVTDAAVLEALGAPIVDETVPLGGQDLVIASLPAPRSLSAGGATPGPFSPSLTDDDAFERASLPNDEPGLDPEALADGVVPGDDAGTVGMDHGLHNDIGALEEAAQYAATGVWQQVPEVAELPPLIGLDDVYVASIDNTELSQDAIALPPQAGLDTDVPFDAISSPTEAGRQFDLDDRGLVVATPEGTLNPDGIMVYSGRPALSPPPTPDRPEVRQQEAADAADRVAQLSLIRPRTRPDDLQEQTERAQLGGVIRSELLSKRPKIRPASLKTEEEESQPATALAVARAVKPRARPANFANLVDRAQRSIQNDAPQATASVAPVTVSPSIPSSASVARQATVERALNLRHVNLIGVYGTPAERRALVRLPSGRYVKVKVGDRIDGGRIVAIGEGQLQYQKGGRNQTLTMPKG